MAPWLPGVTLTLDASQEAKGQTPRSGGRIPLTHNLGVCMTPLSDPEACRPAGITAGALSLPSSLSSGNDPVQVPYEVNAQLFVQFKYAGKLDGFVQRLPLERGRGGSQRRDERQLDELPLLRPVEAMSERLWERLSPA